MVVFSVILALGIYLTFYAGLSYTKPIHIWSDFKAFSARVAADESARHVLSYGGEKEEDDFDDLLKKLSLLSDQWNRVIWIGMLFCLLAGVGIVWEISETRKKKIVEQREGERLW
jgi:hypothetical protein